jgi:hypothetical protein
MLPPAPKILLTAAVFLSIPLAGCIQSDTTRLTRLLKIPELPPSTVIERCGSVDRGGPMWDCVVRTTPGDLEKLISGHEFIDLRTRPPHRVYLASPREFKEADHIHITYDEESGKAGIATHKP